MQYLIIGDFINLALIIYVWVRMYQTQNMEKHIARLFKANGIALMSGLVMDQVWEYFFETMFNNPTASGSLLLNALTCIIFMVIPVSYLILIQFHKAQRDTGDILAMIGSISGIVLLFCNMRWPILFTIDPYFDMCNTPYTAWLYLAYFILLCFILVHDFVHSFAIDTENRTMILFVCIIAGLGFLDLYIYLDVLAVGECACIAYLLLYFAVVRLNDKTDPVTGLPNRNAFNTVFFHRQKPCRTIVFFDLNHLKQYNDTYGHSTGDSYLRAFALTMQEKLTSYGKLYRTGGDEFCFLSDHKAEELKKILDQIRKNGRSNPLYGDYPLDFAFGVSEKKTDETNEALYMRADSLMYLDKRRMKENARSDTDERWN